MSVSAIHGAVIFGFGGKCIKMGQMALNLVSCLETAGKLLQLVGVYLKSKREGKSIQSILMKSYRISEEFSFIKENRYT